MVVRLILIVALILCFAGIAGADEERFFKRGIPVTIPEPAKPYSGPHKELVSEIFELADLVNSNSIYQSIGFKDGKLYSGQYLKGALTYAYSYNPTAEDYKKSSCERFGNSYEYVLNVASTVPGDPDRPGYSSWKDNGRMIVRRMDHCEDLKKLMIKLAEEVKKKPLVAEGKNKAGKKSK